MEVKILSRKMIKPAIPTPNHLGTCKLSFFDQFGPAIHMPLLFFYPSNCTDTFMQEKRDRLIKSLSETLSLFYPLAGRFVKDGMCIDCKDEGVEYLEAEVVNLELAELLREAPKNVDLLHGLVPWDIGEPTLLTTPLLGIQVTMFKCGGLVICSHTSHVIADGFTGFTFVYRWSVACRAGIDQVVTTPSFDLASFFPARDLSVMINSSPPVNRRKNVVTKRFLFDEKTICDLKSKVKVANELNLNPTRVQVVASTMWKALIGVDRANHHGQLLRNSTFCPSVNLRGRTGMETIPYNSCGNFFVQLPAKFKVDNDMKMEDLELHHLVNLLGKNIHNLFANCSKISNPDELVLEVANHVNVVREDLRNDQVDVHFFTSLCNFPTYEVDFGWGKPEWVTLTKVPVEIIILMDSKCGTMIEALVSLTEKSMLGFQTDPDIVALTSLVE